MRPPGIIPARAGFTGIVIPCSAASSDHPRSRGVYARPPRAGDAARGSSPLARGLLIVRGPDGGGERIIPARAGFTAPSQFSSKAVRDHPRSRGVYPCNAITSGFLDGSSPLARGLRDEREQPRPLPGIIPARAGFTRRRPRQRPRRPDHPRSRGVYGPPACGRGSQSDHPRSRGVYADRARIVAIIGGSSPLARGLLAPPVEEIHPVRIIPARAGFTPTRPASPSRSRDHPRSRGVYPLEGGLTFQSPGSSPLARGLLATVKGAGRFALDHPRSRGVYPPTRSNAWAPAWIIPARAGFTSTSRPSPRSACGSSPLARGLPALPVAHALHIVDHPRSRGVYGGLGALASTGGGSSPLARGLPGPGCDCRAALRIIPARAGFTRRAHGRGAHDQDHPRSRGVYHPRSMPSLAWAGSSPLARGLLPSVPFGIMARRIIPARAGFTVRGVTPRLRAMDHPRSRGVYAITGSRCAEVRGSSPLARGLLYYEKNELRAFGIIPARAGFTAPSPRVSCSCRDHPRSRGVYASAGPVWAAWGGSSPLARGLRDWGG